MSAEPADTEAALLRVLRGAPTPEELAAATAALLALMRRGAPAGTPEDESPLPAGWGRTAHSAHRGALSWRR